MLLNVGKSVEILANLKIYRGKCCQMWESVFEMNLKCHLSLL